jgi:hypothetical protein
MPLLSEPDTSGGNVERNAQICARRRDGLKLSHETVRVIIRGIERKAKHHAERYERLAPLRDAFAKGWPRR